MDFFARFLNGKHLFERIETRIMVGITTFVATMVLIGWVAINEGARMAAFEQQFNARSIERGAAMYSTYCSTCHGNEGLGIAGRAPALNNPQLFGHDYMPDVNPERDRLIAEKALLQRELDDVASPPTEERTAEINTRVNEIDTRIAELEQQALSFIGQAQQASLRGYDPYRPDRLKNVEWASSPYNYIYSTLIHGRPVSSAYFPDPMPTWAQVSGGSLRDDQVRDVVNFVLNWDRDFTVEDLLAVQQFAIEPCSPTGPCGGEAVDNANSVIASGGFEELRTQLDAAEADPNAGQTLYNGQALTGTGAILGCSGCHTGGTQAPALEGTWTRVETERLPELTAYADGVDYLIHSILRPSEYIVPPYPDGLMPSDLGSKLTVQDLANIIAYLESQDQ
jgi:mono/diheme cytochrome c family protein